MAETEMSMGEVTRSLGRIERKLDTAMDDHEKRLRALERHMWMTAAGGGAGGAALVGLLVQVVSG